MCNYFTSTSSSTPPTDESATQPKKPRLGFNPDEIIADPAHRIPIEDFPNEITDEVRRTYLLNGPTRAIGHAFLKTLDGKVWRSFQESWFSKFDWLEYSVEKDAAFLFLLFSFQETVTTQHIW